MKKIFLISLFIFGTASLNANTTYNENAKIKLHLKRLACATTATASVAAFVRAIISDLKARPGTAQAEVPLCVIPMCTFLLSCLMAE